MNSHKIAGGHILACWAAAWCLCLVLPLFCDAAAAPAIADEPNVTIEQVLKVWQDRQEATKSLKVTWTEQRHYERGSREGREARATDDEGQPFPREPIGVELEGGFQFDGERHRYETKGRDWDDRAECVAPREFVDIVSDSGWVSFSGVSYGDVDVAHNNGFVRRKSGSSFATREIPELAPLMGTYRALAPDYGHFRPEVWQPKSISSAGVVNGRKCLLVEFVKSSGKMKRCWVAPDIDFRIVRLEIGDRIHVDVQYKEGGEHGVVPASWQSVCLKPRTADVLWVITITVREFLLNYQPAPKDFAFDFPPGTEVTDTSQGGQPVVYAVKGQGNRRIVTRDERMVRQKWSDVMATSEGELAARRNTWHSYLTWGALVVLAVVTVVLALRLRRRRSPDRRR